MLRSTAMNTAPLTIQLSRAMLSPASHHVLPWEQPLALPRWILFRERKALWFIPAARVRGLCLLVMAILCGISFRAGASEVAVDCTELARWTKRPKPPQVNQAHIFCGEWKQNAPGGFHSRPGGLDPNPVSRFTITQAANAQGIYGVTWSYTGHPRSSKFSTMFPDGCSMSQVLNSIAYAATHPIRCPVNAPHWAVCGPNRPTSTVQHSDSFCAANDGTIFMIAIAKLKNGR